MELIDLLMDQKKDGNVLVNDAIDTFYLQLHGHLVKDHSYSEKRNPPHWLLFPINSKASFI